MSNRTLILIIIAAIFLGLGLIFLIIFNSIFILKRLYLNQDYKLKIKYNYYNNSTIGSNIKAIEVMAAKNKKLLPILNFINDYRKTYEKQLEIVKIKLRGLSSLLKTYKLGEIHRTIKQIKFNFNQLDKQQEEYKKFNLDTQKYSNNVSNIYTNLIDIISLISDFNKDNMLDIFYKDVNEFNQINENVHNVSILLNDELESINSENAHRLFLQELTLSKQYLEFSKKIYELNKFHLALNAIIDEVRKCSEAIVNSDYGITLFKKIKVAKDKSNDLLKDVNKQNINEKINNFKQEIKKFEDELKHIKLEINYQEILDHDMNEFEKKVKNFTKTINDHHIQELCQEIIKTFKNDKQIYNYTKNDVEIANRINQELKNINVLRSQKSLTNDKNEKMIKLIIEIYQLMIKFKENNDALYNEISRKNKDLLLLTFKINDLSIKLLQLKQLITENKINNQEINTKLTNYQKEIEKIKTNLSSNLLLDDQSLLNELEDINTFINDSLLLIKNKKEIIEIVKRLKMYANRFNNQQNIDQFKTFEKLQKSEKYYDLIDEYIIFINRNLKNKKVS